MCSTHVSTCVPGSWTGIDWDAWKLAYAAHGEPWRLMYMLKTRVQDRRSENLKRMWCNCVGFILVQCIALTNIGGNLFIFGVQHHPANAAWCFPKRTHEGDECVLLVLKSLKDRFRSTVFLEYVNCEHQYCQSGVLYQLIFFLMFA